MAIKKISYMKLFVLISLFSVVFSNSLLASHELGSARLSNVNLTTNSALFLQDNKYPTISAMPTTNLWQFYDASFSNKLILGIDRYSTLAIADFVATVTVQITSVLPQALGGTTSITTKTLTVKYEGKNDHQSAAAHASINEDIYSFTNGYAVLTNVTGISVSIAGGTATNVMPSNVYLQLETDADRYYTLPQNSTPFLNYPVTGLTLQYIPLTDEFDISWTRINGAEQYDLEWLWLDAEKNVFWAMNPEIDFRNNSTRVRTSQQSYRISNVFEKGQIFFRLRGVGMSAISAIPFTVEAYTPWSWQDLTTIPTTPITSPLSAIAPSNGSDLLFFINLDGSTMYNGQVPPIHEFKKNWQYKATYAEEGKKKEVISYFDGTLRSRQSVTKNNSDNTAIVGETYYDYNGRAVVQALPVPVADATIKFHQYSVVPSAGGAGQWGFNFELNTNTPYNKEFFDLDNIPNSCGVAAKGMHDGHGSANYYSSGSSFVNQLSQGYVPNAEHFPFSQTEFTNDNTGRISKQGGVGKTHQIGIPSPNSHDTKYLYGTPEQVELDRLFGSEVGYNLHYKKNMVVDANGQVSISYLDQEGRTIATALSGQGPTNLTQLTNSVGIALYSSPTATNVVDADLLNKVNATDFDTNLDNNDHVGDELIFNKQILVSTAGTYTISYDLAGTSYSYSCLPLNTCYDCVYDLEINVLDNCQNNPPGFSKITKTLGTIAAVNTNTICEDQIVSFNTSQLSVTGDQLLVNLEQGNYTIVKTLKINDAARTFYLNEYLKSDCVKEQSDFMLGLKPDTSGCDLTCDECIAALGSVNDYTLAAKGTAEEWLREYQTCKEPCEFVSICEVEYITMLADVSPGGQYGDWEDGNGDCDVSLHNLSVYNGANLLPTKKMVINGGSTLNTQQPVWTNPYLRKPSVQGNQTTHFENVYRDDDGTLSKVFVTLTPTVNVYFPPVTNTVLVLPVIGGSTNIGDQFYTVPQNLSNFCDFKDNWRNSWAKSLVYYHPEYPYYDWCLKNSTNTVTPFPVTVLTGTTSITSTISTSDDYDSLLLVTDDITNISLTDLRILCNPIDIKPSPTHYDPYWATNGKYYKNLAIAQTASISPTIDQLTISSPLSYPWNTKFKSATTRFTDYQSAGVNLPVFAALITTSCAIQYGQPISPNQLGCLSTGFAITSGMTADEVIDKLNIYRLAGGADLRNRYWDNFRMMYLSLKQEMQQEAAESYVMNGDYRGCNDGIGDPSFDPMAMGVPFTNYAIFNPFGLFPTIGFQNNVFDQWFFPFHTPNEPQYCNVFTGNLYGTKIKRFPNAKNATDLANNLSAGDPGASIYANTGLCPNAFYFQNLINALGTTNKLNSSTINLSTVPEFNVDLYKVVANNVVPASYTQANWTNITNTTMTIVANMQIGSNSPCPVTLIMPTTYTTGVFDPSTGLTTVVNHSSPFSFSNTGTTPSSGFSFLRIYHLDQITTSGGTSNFTMFADISASSGASSTFTTIVLSGSTCIPLTGCSFTPPCEPTTAAITMQKLLNAIAATGNMCSANSTTPLLLNDPILQPYFLNSFGALLGPGNWQWEKVIGTTSNFIIKDGAGFYTNKIEISLGSVPCSSSSDAFAFANITGNSSGASNFNININTIPSGGTSAVVTTSTTGSVLLNGNPLKMGICGFDLAKCATVPHQTREEMEAFLLKNGTRALLQNSYSNLTSNFNFGFNMRNQLADAYQTYNSTSLNTNPLYYYWNKNTAASTNTLLTGSFFASTLAAGPATLTPTNACEFTLAFADPDSAMVNGHDLNSGTYSLSNFTLATGPMVNLSVFDFSITATFGTTTYTLLGTSSCFGMRPCSECTSDPASGGYATKVTINDFPCIGAPTYTIKENLSGALTVYTALQNCATNPTINNLQYTIGNSVRFNDGLNTTWTSYNSGISGDNGTSLFLMHATGNEFAYTQNFTPQNSCNLNQININIHNKTNGNPQIYFTDFKIKINGVVVPTANVIYSQFSSPNSAWGQFVISNVVTTAGVAITFQITDLNDFTDRNFAIDDIELQPLECYKPPMPCVNIQSFEPFPVIDYEDPCVQYALDLVENEAQELYHTYLDSIKKAFVLGYNKKCMGEVVEQFYMKYNDGDYHFTLYYYDQAGNLVRTVPPEGVKVETNITFLNTIKTERNNLNLNPPVNTKTYFTTHNLQTTYTYNSLNQLVKQETPDAGISYFWYDKLGRLVASQNAKQKAKSVTTPNCYSYTKYDYLGRIAEVGEMIIPYDFVSMSPSAIASWINPSTNDYPNNMASSKTEVTRTYYGDDDTFTPLLAGSNFTSGSQEYLRSRVASVTIEDADDGNNATYAHAKHYSYDVHGNVKELIQENTNSILSFLNHQYKKINYTYDLISGKVNQVAYQPGQADMFLHRYEYDADNRITNVFTSKDNIVWDQDAKYFYYLHGPLSRVEIGHDKVQATDFAYTIQGWIKGVNSNILDANNDIGKDGTGTLTSPTSGGTASQVMNKYNARDVFGYSLTYFNNTLNRDYLAINNTTGGINDFIAGVGSVAQSPDLYNGNIRQMVTSYLDASAPAKTYNTASLLKNYTYDQLNRIKTADAFDGLNLTNNSWPGTTSVPNMYNESFTYDQNGNIKNAQRNGNLLATTAMDNLTYNYLPNTNKLDNVTDAVIGTPYGNDFSSGQTAGNYDYDAIGNLIKDTKENIASIEWTVYGKIKHIIPALNSGKAEIIFNYDASGNRISKTTLYPQQNPTNEKTTYYVRDAQGNVMATYEQEGPNNGTYYLTLKEQHIYGSSRLGMATPNTIISPAPLVNDPSSYTRTLGNKSYELSNHLGNVLTVVSDRKIAVVNTGQVVLSNTFDGSSLDGWVPISTAALSNSAADALTISVVKQMGAKQTLAVNPGESYQVSFDLLASMAASLTLEVYNETSNTLISSTPISVLTCWPPPCTLAPVSYNVTFTPTDNLVSFRLFQGGTIVVGPPPPGSPYGIQIDNFIVKNLSNTVAVDHFITDVNSASDYYSFGSTMPGRNFSANTYKYGFNGKEKDPEGLGGGGSTYDYGFRIYNPNLGRFLSVDPLTESYPWYTPYQFAGNTPIQAVDLDGLEEYFIIEELGSGKYASERKFIKTGIDKGKGTYQFKDATNGITVGEINKLTPEMIKDLSDINRMGGSSEWKEQTIYRGSALKRTDAKQVEENKQKTSTDTKSNDKTGNDILAEDEKKKAKEDPVKKTQTDLKEGICELCTNGSDYDHWGKSLKTISDILTNDPNSKAILKLSGDGGEGATWGGEYYDTGKTVLQNTIQYYEKARDYIIQQSGGEIKKDRILLDLGSPEGNKAKVTIVK